jgi:uncharacterized protein involved in response to NO
VAATLATEHYDPLITLSAGAWIAAFALFLLARGPKLVTARAGG